MPGWETRTRTSRNVTVRRCRLRGTAHAYCIGTETQADFENIVLEDLEIADFGGYGLTGTMGFFTGQLHIPAVFAAMRGRVGAERLALEVHQPAA